MMTGTLDDCDDDDDDDDGEEVKRENFRAKHCRFSPGDGFDDDNFGSVSKFNRYISQ